MRKTIAAYLIAVYAICSVASFVALIETRSPGDGTRFVHVEIFASMLWPVTVPPLIVHRAVRAWSLVLKDQL